MSAVESHRERRPTENTVLEREREIIDAERGETQGKYRGLALSGGGIRSASFSLGVLQALANDNKLSLFDYLSTVSGGGYIGTSLTWFLSKRKEDGKKEFGTKPSNFPFGRRTGAAADSGKESQPTGGGVKSDKILDFVRQNASYLTPGRGLNLVSLLAVAMRGVFVSLLVYGVLLVCAMKILAILRFFTPTPQVSILPQRVATWDFLENLPFATTIAVAVLGALVVGAIWFVFAGARSYARRVRGQRIIGHGWRLVIILAVLGTVPVVSAQLRHWLAGGLTSLGAVGGFFTLLKGSRAKKRKRTPVAAILPQLAAGALIYGLFLTAYSIVSYEGETSLDSLWLYVVVLVFACFLGAIAKLNNVGHHRMYRDRLMELFMPDDETIASGIWNRACQVERVALDEIPDQRPYHLINTNLVLIDSSVRRYRDRGGDSFLLSSRFCGSNATGWWTTREFNQRSGLAGSSKMTLASAMAVSAAAANPNTGAAGRGPTRGRLVSALMTLLNIRLGYWIIGGSTRMGIPTMLVPGFKALLGHGFRENDVFLELTDGGHFDNTGVYELLRRKVGLIILADGSADANFRFGDLANVMERARVDFRAKIRFDEKFSLEGLLPGSAGKGSMNEKFDLAERGYALATITYDDGTKGHLIYLKTTLTPGLPADVYGYRSDNPDFPDQSTGDQFFDERQFEAYRELGYQLAEQALAQDEITKIFTG